MANYLGDYIKNYRKLHSMSLRDFAERANISHTHIDSLEKGFDFRTGKPVRLTNETIQKLASVLNVDEAELFLLSINKKADINEKEDSFFSKLNLDDLSNDSKQKVLEYIKMLQLLDDVQRSKNETDIKDAK
ncbi:MAG: helix-turn-helix transcriptional regulator [Christensenellaceae bacterium]